MSQTDELLESLAGEPSTYTAKPGEEPHIVINADRSITVPDELKRIAVQHDHNVETVTFDCPRYWDEHDLSMMVIYINYRRPDNKLRRSVVSNIMVDINNPNIVHFDWTIDSYITEIQGSLAFLVCASSADENGNQKLHWNSELCKDTYISEGLLIDENMIATENWAIITDLLIRMEAVDMCIDSNWVIAADKRLGDLEGRKIPVKTSDLTNDSGYVAESDYLPTVTKMAGLKEIHLKNVDETRDLAVVQFRKNFFDGSNYCVSIRIAYADAPKTILAQYMRTSKTPIEFDPQSVVTLDPYYTTVSGYAFVDWENTPNDTSFYKAVNINKHNVLNLTRTPNINHYLLSDYVYDGVVALNKDVESFVIQASKSRSDDFKDSLKPLEFVHFSDVHSQHNMWKRVVDYINAYDDYIKFAIHTGDFVGKSLESCVDLYAIAKPTNAPILNVCGNHDTYIDDAKMTPGASLADSYDAICGNTTGWDVVFGTEENAIYYYKDFTDSGVRLIALDDQHWTDAQSAWLDGALAEAKTNNLAVITASHTVTAKIVTDVNCPFVPVDDVEPLRVYATREFESQLVSFKNNGGTHICHLSGHYHYDHVGYSNAGILNVIVDCATYSNAHTETVRVKGKKCYDCFNVVSVDVNTNRLKIVRVGNNTNASLQKKIAFCYDYKTKKLVSTTNYVTDEQLNEALSAKANTNDIPVKTSDLTNDSGFIDENTVRGMIEDSAPSIDTSKFVTTDTEQMITGDKIFDGSIYFGPSTMDFSDSDFILPNYPNGETASGKGPYPIIFPEATYENGALGCDAIQLAGKQDIPDVSGFVLVEDLVERLAALKKELEDKIAAGSGGDSGGSGGIPFDPSQFVTKEEYEEDKTNIVTKNELEVELTNKADKSDLPDSLGDLTNDVGFVTGDIVQGMVGNKTGPDYFVGEESGYGNDHLQTGVQGDTGEFGIVDGAGGENIAFIYMHDEWIQMQGVDIICDGALQGYSCVAAYIGDGIDRIGAYVFADTPLEVLYLMGDYATSGKTIEIDPLALNGCSNLRKIYFGGTKTQFRAYENSSGFRIDWLYNTRGVDGVPISIICTDGEMTYTGSAMPTINSYVEDLSMYSFDGTKITGVDAESDAYAYKYFEIPHKDSNDQSIEVIGASAFANNENIVIAVIPDTVNYIEWQAFGGCTNLQQVRLPKDITMDSKVFYNCPNLTNIKYAGTLAEFGALLINFKIPVNVFGCDSTYSDMTPEITVDCSDGYLTISRTTTE